MSPSVTIGWISAIHKAQRFLKKKADVEVPVLLMHSDKSVYGDTWTAEHNAGDGVLDVKDISKYGKRLGADVTEVGVADGLHDLILSRKDVGSRSIEQFLSGSPQKKLIKSSTGRAACFGEFVKMNLDAPKCAILKHFC